MSPEEIADWRRYAEGQRKRGRFVVMQPDEFLALLDALPVVVGTHVEDRIDALRPWPDGEPLLRSLERLARIGRR